ncbi:DNA-binding transcriptional regulator YiaG [Salinibacter ruber]|jgi:DNA-binding transcriptional regulator YiaG|uniref:hypothetical protein n=1 Tax=Salinibacter ruber TaxID=146919 RepID=UPI00216A5DBC|nr:hypothetical protein [Salinibacter ruber]MCS3635835.1 DNA-binding transcriptional regulator YiaG [Salinibacter ruber]MCS3715356.1 DNA-binding transcriptional regulator YiaG [Salinibacter ruber]
MRRASEIRLTDEEDQARLKEAAHKALQEFAMTEAANAETDELKKVARIRYGVCYKTDLAWMFDVSERTIDAWEIQPIQKSPSRKNLYDLVDLPSQLR